MLISYVYLILYSTVDGSTGANTPSSAISHLSPYAKNRKKACQVLEMFVPILWQAPANFTKLTTYLPLPRIYLLLLGEHPTPFIAARVLRLIQLSLASTGNFGRKFELVSGWSVLRIVLPDAWDEDVRIACFDMLMGRQWADVPKKTNQDEWTIVMCPNVVPAIFGALQSSLDIISGSAPRHYAADGLSILFPMTPDMLTR